MSSRASPQVMVLMGGQSVEREVSLSTGAECATALMSAGYQVQMLDAGPDLYARLSDMKPDVVFNALHGRWGEDGCVQGILEWMGIPYTHSGVSASAIAMDKERSKQIFKMVGLPVAESILADKQAVETNHVMAPPYVVKPSNEGSSIGVYLVSEFANNPPFLSPEMPQKVMVEAFIRGRELTVAVLGDRALGVTDIITDRWYDYDAKYKEGGSHHVIPAKIPQDVYDACMDYALRAHQALGCRGLSRTDFRWDDNRGLDGLVILETNTQPGMTPTSLAPEQAAYCGISFPDLCRWLVEDASCNR